MKVNKVINIFSTVFVLLLLVLIQSGSANSSAPISDAKSSCQTELCAAASTFNLLVADLDGSNASVIKTNSRQDMTHPRVSSDKNWISYTTYNQFDKHGCGEPSNGYFNTEIRAVKMDGTEDKGIIGPNSKQLNSNNYWIGSTREMSYLSGPVTALKFYRTTVDSQMNVVGKPTVIPVVGTVVPMDPQTHLATNKIVYPGLYNPGGGFVKSIFMMNLSDSSDLVGLSVGRDHSGTPIICKNAACDNIMENDPKISPDGKKVAFMRRAPSSGKNSFGWHIFVVDVAKPLAEVDISYSHIGSNVMKNDGLPEWVDNDTLIFSTIDIISPTKIIKDVYTMKADGSQRKKIALPDGFLYSDVFPFKDENGKQRMILAARKLGVMCHK